MDHSISFEFFPPKTDNGRQALRVTRAELAKLKPDFFSVTFGAGGSTREGTFDTIKEIKQDGIDGAPHISCISATKKGVAEMLNDYAELGVKRLVALRGDRPSGVVEIGDFRYANELVEFIRVETGKQFHIEVAAYPEMHPESRSPGKDLEHFKRKIDAGADSAITQYFYAPDAYFEYVEAANKLGINKPIVPGVMPITNYQGLVRFSDACGAEIPRWIRLRLEQYQDDDNALAAFGLDVTTSLCEHLIQGGAPGLHFYTLNKAGPSTEVYRRLNLA